ncbi:MAG: lysophospholipid acyltransferase family protein [Pseudoxanthomonas suwonensis]|nr:lysophospholipid acyltransferase family protein [Pseudoxanthomonas suwonensis]
MKAMAGEVMTPGRPAPRARLAWRVFNMLQLGFTLLWSIGWISLALLLHRLGGGTRLPLRMAARGWAPGLLGGAGARLQVEGADAIDWSQPYLLVSNHQSVIDICALFRASPVPMRFLFKRETLAWPFVGWYGRAMDMPVIDRDNPRSAPLMLRHVARLLQAGDSVCLFPEGTRSRDGRLGGFKAGPFEAARMAGVPVLPVALSGAGTVLPAEGLFAVRPGTIRVRFGQPIPATATRNQLAGKAQAQVQSMMDDWAARGIAP